MGPCKECKLEPVRPSHSKTPHSSSLSYPSHSWPCKWDILISCIHELYCNLFEILVQSYLFVPYVIRASPSSAPLRAFTSHPPFSILPFPSYYLRHCWSGSVNILVFLNSPIFLIYDLLHDIFPPAFHDHHQRFPTSPSESARLDTTIPTYRPNHTLPWCHLQ